MRRPIRNSKRGAIAAAAALAVSTIGPLAAGAAGLPIELSASPDGIATNRIAMRIPAEANAGTIQVFLRDSGDVSLRGVRLNATPLVDETGVSAATPTFTPRGGTLPYGGALQRYEVAVSGLDRLGTFTSSLYATHEGNTQPLATLTVVHTPRTGDVQIAPIDETRIYQQIPRAATQVNFLMTVRNDGETPLVLSKPVISSLTGYGTTKGQAALPALRVSRQDGHAAGNVLSVGPKDSTTLTLVLDGLKETGRYTGTLRLSAVGHVPVEQTFAFEVKQGPAIPAALISLGVAIAFAFRRRYSSGRVSRAGQRRIAQRLQADLEPIRRRARDLEPREERVLETLERRLADISDELDLAGGSHSAGALSEIDLKIDLFADFLIARRHVRALAPESLQQDFEPVLHAAVSFLTDVTPWGELDDRFEAQAKAIARIPKAVEATVGEHLERDVDRFLANVEMSSTVAEAVPVRVLRRIERGRQLVDAGQFGEASAELGGAQLAFTKFLAEEFVAKLPDAASPPPGFVTEWPRYRAAIAEGLRVVRRERRPERAAENYRRLWQDYVVQLATRLKIAAARERRAARGARKDQLGHVVDACDDAVLHASELHPAAVGEYMRAVESFLAPAGRRRSVAQIRALLDQTQLPQVLTVIAAGLTDAERLERPAPRGADSAASLTRRIRSRHWSLAVLAALAAIPTGLVLLWSPNETWGTLADGAAVFAFGFGLYALAAGFDAAMLGWRLARQAARATQGGEQRTLLTPVPR